MKYKATITLEVEFETTNGENGLEKINANLVDKMFKLDLLETFSDFGFEPIDYNATINITSSK